MGTELKIMISGGMEKAVCVVSIGMRHETMGQKINSNDKGKENQLMLMQCFSAGPWKSSDNFTNTETS
jgi:hypothetical protein